METQWAAETRAGLLRPAVGVVRRSAGYRRQSGPLPRSAPIDSGRTIRRDARVLVAKLPLGEDQAEAVELIDRSAELLGLPDASVDVVVATLVLCSVTDPARA